MTDRKKAGRGREGIARRTFLKGSLAAGAALAAPMVFVRTLSAQDRVLKIVHWKHFVPDYDKWFDVFAKEFGESHKCRVEVDYVATVDLPTAIAADISRGGGHDVFHLNGTGAWLYDQVLVEDAHSTIDNGVLSAAQITAHHNTTLANMTSFGRRDVIMQVPP